MCCMLTVEDAPSCSTASSQRSRAEPMTYSVEASALPVVAMSAPSGYAFGPALLPSLSRAGPLPYSLLIAAPSADPMAVPPAAQLLPQTPTPMYAHASAGHVHHIAPAQSSLTGTWTGGLPEASGAQLLPGHPLAGPTDHDFTAGLYGHGLETTNAGLASPVILQTTGSAKLALACLAPEEATSLQPSGSSDTIMMTNSCCMTCCAAQYMSPTEPYSSPIPWQATGMQLPFPSTLPEVGGTCVSEALQLSGSDSPDWSCHDVPCSSSSAGVEHAEMLLSDASTTFEDGNACRATARLQSLSPSWTCRDR